MMKKQSRNSTTIEQLGKIVELAMSCESAVDFEAIVDAEQVRDTFQAVIRWSLQELEQLSNHAELTNMSLSPIEVRVVPIAVVQFRPSTTVHKRGTPPNVVEITAFNWLRLLADPNNFSQVLDDFSTLASGSNVYGLKSAIELLNHAILK